MFIDFFYHLKSFKIPVSITEWLTFMSALENGFGNSTLTGFYYLGRSILIKSEVFYDQYDIAFKTYFENIKINELDFTNVMEWLKNAIARRELSKEDMEKIKTYTFDELKKLFEERLKEQKEQHNGGSKWIGTGGTSPFGHSGYHPGGIRIGGDTNNKSAVQIASERRFKNYRNDIMLDIRQMKVALKKLRILKNIGLEDQLDIDETIDKTCKNFGEIELIFKRSRKNNAKLLLLMDTGGSMLPYAELVDRLFSAANSANHFRDFQHFYFHNCVYDNLYIDSYTNETYPTPLLLKNFPSDYKVIMVGDAMMAPSELFMKGGAIDYYYYNEVTGIEWLNRLYNHFSSIVWLNPIKSHYWNHPTVKAIYKQIPMFELTVKGLEEAVGELVRRVA